MIEKHLYTVCAPHKRDLISLSDGRVNEDVVFIFLNTVGNRFNRNLYYIEARGFNHASEFLASATQSNDQLQYQYSNCTYKTPPKRIFACINKFLLRGRSFCNAQQCSNTYQDNKLDEKRYENFD